LISFHDLKDLSQINDLDRIFCPDPFILIEEEVDLLGFKFDLFDFNFDYKE